MGNKILVLGANGTVGRHLVAELLARGETVKAASRSGTAPAGGEGVRFDFGDAGTFDAAFDGVDRAFVMLPAGNVAIGEMLEPVLRAAIARGVKVVYQSVFGADADDSIPYRQMELLLEGAGTPYVILRPNWFADNFHSYWLPGIHQGVIAVPAGEGRSSFIDARDIARCAACALTRDAFDGRAFNLTGPEALGYADAAALIAEAAGHPVAYQPVDEEAFVAMLIAAQLPEAYARFLASIFYPVREGWTAAVTGDVETLTGRAPRALATYVRDHAEAFRAR